MARPLGHAYTFRDGSRKVMMILKKIESQIEIEFDSDNEAEIVLKSIEPELMDSPSERTETEIKCKDNLLIIKIIAMDSTSFRASLNSYLRWIDLSKQVLELKN
jgi:KEOPS complex subunit Pcc1